ncbi:hypothetical protein QLQ12_32500 [Actinoplanes sp. NEAU-A12]|uniref:Fe2OG dioxygenase domain-containing protein n=1 Tax=Actinoplanes sandaracinus TaxID=3045177 RepID=A0ABT6WUP5_9ACTN|nr:hypothetical protein [Actinoplanes sandaracinus]MDI6103340.1 hypothetical protein [Actinoplanes sandaracinus]
MIPEVAEHDIEPAPAALGLDEVLVVDSVVTPEEQALVRAWAAERHRAGALLDNPIDPGRHLTPYRAAHDRELTALTRQGRPEGEAGDDDLVWIPEVGDDRAEAPPEEFWRIRQRVVDRLRLHHLRDDPYKGSFLAYVTTGGSVHPHRDARLSIDGTLMPLLRCNVLLARPAKGGLPVIADREFDVPDRGMWAFYPTELLHSAPEVGGPDGRVTLSFGFVVDPRTLWQRPYRIRADIDPRLIADFLRRLRHGTVSADRVEILERVLAEPGVFRVRTIADAVRSGPWEVWDEIHRLRRTGLVESLSAPPAEDCELSSL